MVSWAELPADLIYTIAVPLHHYKDYIRFRAVCVSWRSSVPVRPRPDQLTRIPWLIQPLGCKTKINKSYNGYYSFFEDKIHQLDLAEAKGKLCRGSIGGWLVLVDPNGGPGLHLLNPLAKIQIALPPMSTLPNVISYDANRSEKEYYLTGKTNPYYLHKEHVQNYLLHKIVLSSSPSLANHSAMAIYGEFCTLAFCKHGDKEWKEASTPDSCFEDVEYHDGKFYALSGYNYLWACDINSSSKMVKIEVEPPTLIPGSRSYLVSSSHHGLMMVQMLYDHKVDPREKIEHYYTSGFKVHKLVASGSGRSYKWTNITSLEDYMLFLGMKASILVSSRSAHDHLKGNSIYFTDDYGMQHDPDLGIGGFDFGMFNLEDETIHTLPGYKKQMRLLRSHGYKANKKFLVWPPAVWMIPNPC